MKTYIQFISENLNIKQSYKYYEIFEFVNWFYKNYGKVANSEGWDIFESDSDYARKFYNSNNKYNSFWLVDKIDENDDGYPTEISTLDIDKLAKEIGIIEDPYKNGLVIGFNGINFLENPEKIKESLYINPIMKEHIETWKLKIDTEKYNL